MTDSTNEAAKKAASGHRTIASPLRALSPLPGARHAALLHSHTATPPTLPRAHIQDAEVKTPSRARSWWRRWFGWIGPASLGVAAIAVPKIAEAAMVQVQVVTPRSDPLTTEANAADHVQAVLDWLDARERQASAGKLEAGVFDEVLARVAEKAADLAIDACLLLAAKGIWRAATRRSAERLTRDTLFPGAPDDAKPADHDAENFHAATAGVAQQDTWLLAIAGDPVPPPVTPGEQSMTRPTPSAKLVRSDADFLAAGQRYVAAMGHRLKPSICAEKGLARGAVGETTKEIGKHIRKSLFKGDIGAGLALAVAGLAASIAKQGLEDFCRESKAVG